MKPQGKGGGILLPSPTGGGALQVHHDYQRVSFKTHAGNGLAAQNGPHPGREQVGGGAPGSPALGRGAQRSSTWTVASGSQALSGAEDNSTDPHETLTESSTLTFVDAHAAGSSAGSPSPRGGGAGAAYLREFALIDDDDDGDMSLREKTVTDLSGADGRAADLVCRRLFSSSSGSASDAKAESPAPADPRPDGPRAPRGRGRCCACCIL